MNGNEWGVERNDNFPTSTSGLLNIYCSGSDDMLMVWTHGEEKQDEFIQYLNNIHTTIKFTSGRSTMSNILFVDANVQLHEGK